MRRLIALALLCLPSLLRAQQPEATIAPGMTRAQVVAVLGAPATQRSANGFTYMFYRNSCGRSCGMQDLVILQKDSVTDAIFRSANRHYSGRSSSPQQVPPGTAPRPATTPMTIRKDEAPAPAPASPAPMKPKANDTTPSIPLDQKPLPPAPAPSAPEKTTSG